MAAALEALLHGLPSGARRWLLMDYGDDQTPAVALAMASERSILVKCTLVDVLGGPSAPDVALSAAAAEALGNGSLFEGHVLCPVMEDDEVVYGLVDEVNDFKGLYRYGYGNVERGRFVGCMRAGRPTCVYAFMLAEGTILMLEQGVYDIIHGRTTQPVLIRRGRPSEVATACLSFTERNCCEFCSAAARKCECSLRMQSKQQDAWTAERWGAEAPVREVSEPRSADSSLSSSGERDGYSSEPTCPLTRRRTNSLWNIFVEAFEMIVRRSRTREVTYRTTCSAVASKHTTYLLQYELNKSMQHEQQRNSVRRLVQSLVANATLVWLLPPLAPSGAAESSSSTPPPSGARMLLSAEMEVDGVSAASCGSAQLVAGTRRTPATIEPVDDEGLVAKRARPSCPQCGQSFSRKYEVSRHVRGVHNGERDFKCALCARSYALKQHLTQHVAAMHDGKREFGCEQCSMLFTTKQKAVRHHRAVHQHERPHQCSKCDSTYFQRSDLRRHLRGKHGSVGDA